MNDFEYEFKEPYEPYFNWGGVQLITREGAGGMTLLDRICCFLVVISLFAFVIFLWLQVWDISERVEVLRDAVYRLEHPVLEGME